MTLPAHLAGDYLALKITDRIGNNSLTTPFFISVGMIASVLPDIDVFSSRLLKDHHTVLHTPLFWLGTFIVLFLIGQLTNSLVVKSLAVAIFLGAMTHLFLDWLSGRTTGIQIFYPFSTRQYSLYPLKPKKGEIPLTIIPHVDYMKFYTENIFLLAIEGVIILIGLICLGTTIFKSLFG